MTTTQSVETNLIKGSQYVCDRNSIEKIVILHDIKANVVRLKDNVSDKHSSSMPLAKFTKLYKPYR